MSLVGGGKGTYYALPGTGERVFFDIEPQSPVPLHRITLTALMDCKPLPLDKEASVSAAYDDPTYVDDFVQRNPCAHHEATSRKLRLHRTAVDFVVAGYSVGYDPKADDGPIVTLFDNATGSIAGGMHGKNIYVSPEHRGRDLGAEMLILAFDLGLRHPTEMNEANTLSAAGRANRVAAHRIAVSRAIDSGLEVPPEVLEDYPELTTPAWAAA